MLGITQLFPCDVECYSSTRYGERPTALVIGQARLKIDEIINTWRVPDGVVFHVRTQNDQTFELLYDQHSAEWSFSRI